MGLYRLAFGTVFLYRLAFGTVCSVSCALLLVVARVEMCTYSLEQRGGVAVDGRPTFGAPSRRCLRVCSPTFREDVAMGTQVPRYSRISENTRTQVRNYQHHLTLQYISHTETSLSVVGGPYAIPRLPRLTARYEKVQVRGCSIASNRSCFRSDSGLLNVLTPEYGS